MVFHSNLPFLQGTSQPQLKHDPINYIPYKSHIIPHNLKSIAAFNTHTHIYIYIYIYIYTVYNHCTPTKPSFILICVFLGARDIIGLKHIN